MTRRRFDGDPIAALRRSDPIAGRDVPTDTSGTHARALFEEITTMETETRPSAAPRRAWAMVAASAMVAAVAIGAVVLSGGNTPDVVAAPTTTQAPDTTEPPVDGGPIAGMCLPYTHEYLAEVPEAFDGTVTDITIVDSDFGPEETVTFQVHRWFRGDGGDTVILTAYGMSEGSFTSLGEGILAIGDRYLVSAGEGSVWACGFTLAYDADEADLWEATFSG